MKKQKYKPVWAEGMFLKPHHFQQLDRYIEYCLQLKYETSIQYFWGFKNLEIDENELDFGNINVKNVEGIFPDGTIFKLTDLSKVSVYKVPNLFKNELLYLAIPHAEIVEREVFFDSSSDASVDYKKYKVIEREIDDICDINQGPIIMQMAELNIKIISETEYNNGGWVGLPFIKILEKNDKNNLLIDTNFIPPLLFAGCSQIIMLFIKEINGLLSARADLLKNRMQRPGRSGTSEVTEFMLLNVVNKYRAKIQHIVDNVNLHPEMVFKECLTLASELATFASVERGLLELPKYNHDNLYLSFLPLMEVIRRYLTTILDELAIRLPLVDEGNGILSSQVPDINIFKNADFILAVYADMPAEHIRTRFLTQSKFGPIDKIMDLVHLQLQGIPIKLLTNVPRQLPYSAGYLYFGLENKGELWSNFEKTGKVALHVAGDFPALDLEFWAVKRD